MLGEDIGLKVKMKFINAEEVKNKLEEIKDDISKIEEKMSNIELKVEVEI